MEVNKSTSFDFECPHVEGVVAGSIPVGTAICPIRLVVRMLVSQAGDTGSNPVWDTNIAGWSSGSSLGS